MSKSTALKQPANKENVTTESTELYFLGQPIDRKGKTLNDDQLKIFNRYNHWKSNLMCLYNHIECYALPYPARTVQFLPNSKVNISSKNQYPRYTNCPFIYPSHCTVPKQGQLNSQINDHKTNSKKKDNDNENNKINHNNPCTQSTKMTPIYYIQSMNYFVPNRIEEQEAIWNLFHNNNNNSNNNNNNLNFSNIDGIRSSSLQTGILPYNNYMHSGPCVESAYDVYRLRIMPQQPHLIATRSYHEDIAIYWLDYNYLSKPLDAFHKINKNNVIPERSGCTISDDEDDEDDDDDMDIDINNSKTRKRKRKRRRDSDYPTKKQRLSDDDDEDDNNNDDNNNDDNLINIEVGTGSGYLIAVGQTSTKTKTGWGLAFNPSHSGMFITGNSDGSIACWDINMIDNPHCMTKMGKFKKQKNASDPNIYMKDSKIKDYKFNDGPPFISKTRTDEYHWFEEFEKYGNWGTGSSSMNQNLTNPDIMSLDWCYDSSQIFVSSSANGRISIWDRRSKTSKKKPVLWTWGTSHNQSILSISWNPIQHSLIASGDKASKVRIWDIRSFNRHLIQLSQHESSIYHVKWCPYNKYLLASSSSDKMLFIYDLRRTGLSNNIKKIDESNPNNSISPNSPINDNNNDDDIDSISKLLESLSKNQVGNMYNSSCPELVFAHFGHTSCIPEFDWSPSGDLTIISTDMDGIIHTWQPPMGMLNTFAWTLHSQKSNYIL